LSSAEETPLFTVHRKWLGIIGLGAFFVGFGILSLISYVATKNLSVLLFGVVLFALFFFIFYILYFLGSEFRFYEAHFTRKYRGVIRQDIPYWEIKSIDYYKRPLFSKSTPDSSINLSVNHEGQYFPFVIQGNPKNKDLGVHLYDWLKTKVRVTV
jgi:hypothetical protein